jgi:hypothetical protein
MIRLLWCTVAVGLVCGACQKPVTRLNAPPHGVAEQKSELQAEYTHMADNALLADMVVSDVHFAPHRAILNSLGEERLSRLAALMELYGGTIRLSTNETDSELVAQRIDQVQKFLSEAGIATTTETVALGLPGSRGMDAAQAVLIKANEGTYVSKKKSASIDMGMGAPMGSKSGQ